MQPHVDSPSAQPVAPSTAMTGFARMMLGYLASHKRGDGSYPCIAMRNNAYYVVPTPGYNWDGRDEPQSVSYPRAVPELTSLGLLEHKRHGVENYNADYSAVGANSLNEIWSLTEKGKRKGAEILAKSKQ